jgi:hypothetical protein
VTRGTYTRRRNLLVLGYERAAKYVFTSIRFNACGGRQGVFVDDNGAISLYRPSHPKFADKRPKHLVGVYGTTIELNEIEDDLICRLRELAALGHEVRSLGHTT